MAGLFEWLIDRIPSDDVIDLCFILSDLVDIPITEAEITETAYFDAVSQAQAQGYYTRGGHLFDAEGQDLGPCGKVVL